MRTIIFFLVTGLFAITAYAANNWDEPCTSGVCHFDLDPDEGPSSGTLKIWGSHKVISDITEAAGWRILNCHEEDMEQSDVRMFCFSPTAPCAHLFSHDGPENKIVRLPKKCGKNPFARIVRVWTSHDQSLPPKLARRLQKRDGRLPLVYNVAFDTNFHMVDPIHGPVHFAVQAATIPNVNLNIDTHLPLQKRSDRPVQRSHEDIGTRALESIRDTIRSHVKDAKYSKDADDASVNRRDIGADIHNVKTNVIDFAKTAKHKIEHAVHVHFHKHKTFIFSHNFNNVNITLIDITINCPPFYPGIRADFNLMGTIFITMGVSVSGTIIPRNIIFFETITHLTADLDLILTVSADVFIRFEKSPPPLFTIPIDEIDFPGILSLGPEFQMNSLAGVAFDFVAGTRIELKYHVKNAEIIFPNKKGEKMTPPDIGFGNENNVQLSSTPFVRGVAQIDLHVIPTIFAGIKALGKEGGFDIRADCFLLPRYVAEYNFKTHHFKTRGFDDVDLELRDMLDARHPIHEVPISARSMEEMGLGSTQGKNSADVVATNKRSVAPQVPLPLGPAPWGGSGLTPPPGVQDPVTKGVLNGCFQLLILFDFSVGALQTLFGVFDQNTRFSVWRQVYLLYQHCDGMSQPKGGSTVNLFHKWWQHPILPRHLEDTSPPHKTSLVKRSELNRVRCLSRTTGAAMILNTQNINLSQTKPLRR